MFIFHKPEVQRVILICSAGLNFDWFKKYGLKCVCVQGYELTKIETDKWPFYDPFWPIFANYMLIFHKSEVQMIILRSWVQILNGTNVMTNNNNT